jgi:outer membrane protein assembly factor BamB
MPRPGGAEPESWVDARSVTGIVCGRVWRVSRGIMVERNLNTAVISSGALIKRVAGPAILLSVVAAMIFFVLLHQSRSPLVSLQLRQPGMDRSAPAGQVEEQSPILLGKLIPGPGQPANIAGEWPGFRGAKGNNIATGTVGGEWKVLWKVALGEGYAGAAVRDGRVYLFDYDQVNQADALRCLSLADGQEIWRFAYPIKIKRNHGMSRTVPSVTDKYVVALGPKCQLICLDATTGEFRWGRDLVKEFNVEVPQWYAGQCPLIDGDRVILATGGNALFVAFDLATGKVLWQTPNPRDWKMTHSSPVPLEFAGQRQYVACFSSGVAGIAADDGRLLWETDAWQISIATVPSPVVVGDGKIFLSGGYNAGSLMLQLTATGPEILFRLKASEFGATQQTPVLYQGHLYGVRPDGQLTCLDLNGKILWTSGNANKFGLGPFLVTNGQILVLNDDGWLTLAEASPTGYRQLARARVLTGHDAWGPMALVNGRLLARDLTQMVCLDVKP